MWNKFTWLGVGPNSNLCEHDNKTSGSLKDRELIDQVSNFQQLKIETPSSLTLAFALRSFV
jgi:hypothetical protein